MFDQYHKLLRLMGPFYIELHQPGIHRSVHLRQIAEHVGIKHFSPISNASFVVHFPETKQDVLQIGMGKIRILLLVV